MISSIFATLGLAAGALLLAVKSASQKEKLPLNLVASGLTLKAKMKSINDLFGSVLSKEAARIQIPVSTAAAILAVESSGRGFGSDGKLLIRFENHVFAKRSGNDTVKSTHKNNAAEFEALNKAIQIDEKAAYKSISMGIGQIMGFNAGRVGYVTAKEMYDVFSNSLEAQIAGIFDFVNTDKNLLNAARTNDFKTFAYYYNGSGYAANKYDEKLENAKKAFIEATGLV